MNRYYVNDNPQEKGEHEVHKDGCSWLHLIESKTDLGYHSKCEEAVEKASEYYDDVDGCEKCIPDCHTK